MKQMCKRLLYRMLPMLLTAAILLPHPTASAISLDGVLDGVFFAVDAVMCGKEVLEGDTGLESCYAAALDMGFFFVPYAVNTGSKVAKNLSIGGRAVSKADDVIDIYKSCDTVSDLAKHGFSVIDNADDLKIGKSIFGRYGDLKAIGSKGGKVEMHHLNPKALSNLFGRNSDDMLATAWSTEFHRLGADPGRITTKLNNLVDSVKQITGGANAYSHAAFSKYISGIGKVYSEAGPFYSGLVKIDALASPGGLQWLEHLGVKANIAVKALSAARTDVMALAGSAKGSADETIARTMCNTIYDGTNDSLCVELYSFLTGGVELGEDVTAQYAGKEVRIKSVESGGYVCGENNSTVHTHCGESAGIYECVQTADNWLGLRLKNGNWLSVQDGDYLRTTGGNLQAWECFKVFRYNGCDYLYAQKNDCYVQVTDEVSRNLRAVRGELQGLKGATWERFQLETVNSSSGGNAGSSTGKSSNGEADNISGTTYVENQYYKNPQATFTEGYYTGQWSNGSPNGYGKFVFSDVNGDGKRYSLSTSVSTYYGLYYEGNFVNGYRYGTGTMYYEGGYKDEGTFYGAWAKDKVVFEGKRWLCTDRYDGYWPWKIIAANTTSAKSEESGAWVSVSASKSKVNNTISYNANGGSGAPASQTKAEGAVLTLSDTIPARDGYAFLGWSTNCAATAADYRPGDNFTANANTTLYAVWQWNGIVPPTPSASVTDESVALTWDKGEAEGYYVWRYDMSLPYEQASKCLNSGKPAYSQFTDNTVTPGVEYYYQLQSVKTAKERSYDGYGSGVSATIPESEKREALPGASSWAQADLIRAYDIGLVSQDFSTDYTTAATRIAFIRLAYNAIEKHYGWMQEYLYGRGLVDNMDYGPPQVFRDVPAGGGYDGHDDYRIAALYALGIITGVNSDAGNQRLEPHRAITREEAAVLLDRVFALLHTDAVDDRKYTVSDPYADDPLISQWARSGVYRMKEYGVMRGTGGNRFSPQDSYTVEQAIVTFVRLSDMIR